MEFIVAVFSAGIAFLLLGIIGRVEAYKIKAGTDNKNGTIRTCNFRYLFFLGNVSIYLSHNA